MIVFILFRFPDYFLFLMTALIKSMKSGLGRNTVLLYSGWYCTSYKP